MLSNIIAALFTRPKSWIIPMRCSDYHLSQCALQPKCFSSTNLTLDILIFQVVNQRDLEITAIARSIEELTEIFKEFAVLLIVQGFLSDLIESNMEPPTTTQICNIFPESVCDRRKYNLPTRCIVMLIILIIVFLVVLIVKNHHLRDRRDKSA